MATQKVNEILSKDEMDAQRQKAKELAKANNATTKTDKASAKTTETPAAATNAATGTTTPTAEQKPAESNSDVYDNALKQISTMEGPAGDLIRKQLGISNEKKYEDQIIQGYDDQIKDMDSFISQMQTNVQNTEAEAQEEKQAKKKMFASDLTEAAAAIVNLIGTTKGASSQTWTSPHQTWVSRIDTLRKERETKLNTYRTQLASLNQAKRQLQQSKAAAALSYEKLNSQDEQNQAKLEMQAQQLQQKIITADQNMALKMKGYDQKRAQAIYADAMKRWSSYMSNQARLHNNPGTSETIMKQFLQQAIDFYDKVSPASDEWEGFDSIYGNTSNKS